MTIWSGGLRIIYGPVNLFRCLLLIKVKAVNRESLSVLVRFKHANVEASIFLILFILGRLVRL